MKIQIVLISYHNEVLATELVCGVVDQRDLFCGSGCNLLVCFGKNNWFEFGLVRFSKKICGLVRLKLLVL